MAVMNVHELYFTIRKRLLDGDEKTAALEAREILKKATGFDRAALARDPAHYPTKEQTDMALRMTGERLSGKPLAYILGEWSFFDLDLTVKPGVLIPRADSEVLAGAGMEMARKLGPGARVLDLGCGSGCLGLAIARHVPDCHVTLADVSEDALRVARENTRRHDLGARVACVWADMRLPPPPQLGHFHVLVCNPPYIAIAEELDASVRDYEPALALRGGEDGLLFYRAVAAYWQDAFVKDAAWCFEVSVTGAGPVCGIMERAGLTHLETLKDSNGRERAVLFRLDQKERKRESNG